ncbi:cytochrome oxidase assembly protein-domain-containing protein [Lactarius pseudohatsudake]|nr:cytochrome oxidase assembly protein-domain-containing protein [Lactarius pseudohatsudake]
MGEPGVVMAVQPFVLTAENMMERYARWPVCAHVPPPPKGPVGAASPCHRGLHRLRFGFPVCDSRGVINSRVTRGDTSVLIRQAFQALAGFLQQSFRCSPRQQVGNWLLLSSALVIAVIVVGGVTRLTESGLSITEWRPITGVLPPLSRAEWESEFDKYKATPELNSRMALDDFKSIYYMEWGTASWAAPSASHLSFPLAYFAARGRLARTLRTPLLGMAALLGAQGALGWYMVRSGLEEPVAGGGGADNAVPRVSQYRLAAHLGAALALYAGMFAAALSVTADWRFARDGTWGRLRDGRTWDGVLRNPLVRRFKAHAAIVTGLVFLTALSATADAADGGKGTWRNLFENPTTVQFDHRVLAMTTYLATALLFASTRRAAVRAALPPLAVRATAAAFAMANVQAALGISTVLYLVPVPLAATHQAGSVALLSAVLHVLLALRRPGAAARAWRQANLAREAAAKAKVTK